ncbi:MAG: 50S ribosomal protein L25 [Pirellulales bacterium]|nr:50S ribosomal protein L25 [Pirellulales bacterium]
MPEIMLVEKRDIRGKHHARRLRSTGKLPAVLYGHGEPTLSLTISADELHAALRHGVKIVELQGEASGQALLHVMQWDTYSSHVLHVDLLRVKAGERVKIEVPIELRGEAPGTKAGGVVEHILHQVEIETDVSRIPDKLHVNINTLGLDAAMTIDSIEDLPEGAKVLEDSDLVIVQCVLPAEELEPEEIAAEMAEPEVIGQKHDMEEES